MRPAEGNTGFYVVAGERRFRASIMAGLGSIPAVVRLINEQEALSIAIKENLDRDDMSASEEAKAAQRMLSMCDGDKHEAALALKWSDKVLNSRLSLLHCTEEVLEALEEKKIKLGHAEILSKLSAKMQRTTLKSVIEGNVPVSKLHSSLSSYAYKLDSAFFDIKGCDGCKHCTDTTQDLFENNIESGHCTDRDCYDKKTQTALKARKTELLEEHPVVWMDIEKPEDSRCHVVKNGSNGVGEEQYSMCQGCANFGALLNTAKGEEGTLDKNMCFDTDCNKEKVKTHQNAVTEQKKEKTNTDTAENKSSDSNKGATKKAATSNASPKKVIEFAENIHRQTAKKAAENDNKVIKVTAILALKKAWSTGNAVELETELTNLGGAILTKSGNSDAVTMKTLYTLDDAALNKILRLLSCSIIGDNHTSPNGYDLDSVNKMAASVLTVTKTDLSEHFIVNKEYLETQTISGLKSLVEEAGVDKWYEAEKGEGETKKTLLKGDRATQIKNIDECGFDWKGFIPKSIAVH